MDSRVLRPRLQRFKPYQRVIVVESRHALFGKTGTVHRLRKRDDAAWVRMDDELPTDMQSFDDDRRRDVVLYPDDCGED